MSQKPIVSIDYFSDLLCVWAYVAQARVDELHQRFGSEIRIVHRYCPVFADTAHKIGAGWADRGGYQGFGKHVREVAARFGHVEVHPGLWDSVRPASSTGAQLYLKAVELLEGPTGLPAGLARRLSWQLRLGFFRDGLDIGSLAVLRELAAGLGVPADVVQAEIDSGRAYAALAADERDKDHYRIEGSPSFVLNEGRQKLYGNVGYRVLDANIRELLREPQAGEASWC